MKVKPSSRVSSESKVPLKYYIFFIIFNEISYLKFKTLSTYRVLRVYGKYNWFVLQVRRFWYLAMFFASMRCIFIQYLHISKSTYYYKKNKKKSKNPSTNCVLRDYSTYNFWVLQVRQFRSLAKSSAFLKWIFCLIHAHIKIQL